MHSRYGICVITASVWMNVNAISIGQRPKDMENRMNGMKKENRGFITLRQLIFPNIVWFMCHTHTHTHRDNKADINFFFHFLFGCRRCRGFCRRSLPLMQLRARHYLENDYIKMTG